MSSTVHNGILIRIFLVTLIVLSGCGGQIRSAEDLSAMMTSAPEEKPRIRISSSTPTVTNATEIPVSIEFDTAVPLKNSDVAVSGGRLFNCTPGIRKSFQCTLVADSKDVSLQVISGTVKTSSGLDTGGSNVLGFVVSTADPVYGLCIRASKFNERFQSMGF